MATSPTTATALAIRDTLNTHSFSAPFDDLTWKFNHLPTWEDKKQLEELQAVVFVPGDNLYFDDTIVSRGCVPLRREIYVMLTQKISGQANLEESGVGTGDDDRVEDLKALAEEAYEHLYANTPYNSKTLQDIGFSPYFSEEMWSEHRVFVSIISMEFL